MKRSAISAASMAKALSQPNRRSDGRLEKTERRQTAGQHDRGQDQRGPDEHRRALDARSPGSAPGVLAPHAVEEMDRRAEAEAERNRQRDDAGKLQAVAEQPQQRARGDDRKYARRQARPA